MRNKKMIMIFGILLIEFALFITPTKAATATKSYTPLEDTFTDDAYPTSSYGSEDFMTAGNYLYGGDCRAFIQFEITDLPSDIQSVSLVFQITYIEAAMDLYFYKVNDDFWFEDTLTHNNRPTDLTSMGYISYSSTGEKTATFPVSLDLTTEGSFISFELYPTFDTSLAIQIATKENTGGYRFPTLRVEYSYVAAAPPPPIGLIVGIVIGIVAVGGVAGFFVYRSKKKGRDLQIPPAAPVPGIIEKKPEPIPYTKIAENVKKVFEVSSGNRIDLEMLRDAVPMDKQDFNNKVLDLAKNFGFKIEVTTLHITDEKRDAFINALLNALR